MEPKHPIVRLNGSDIINAASCVREMAAGKTYADYGFRDPMAIIRGIHGEFAFERWLADRRLEFTHHSTTHHPFDFEIHGVRVEIKTTGRQLINVGQWNEHSRHWDLIVFVQDVGFNHFQIIGWIRKSEFLNHRRLVEFENGSSAWYVERCQLWGMDEFTK